MSKKKLTFEDIVIWLVFIVVVFICIHSLYSCKTQKNYMNKNHIEHDTVYVHKIDTKFDSIYVDKWHTIYQKGDTFWRIDSIRDIRWLIKEKIDTFNHIEYVTDSVEIEKTIEVRRRNGYDRFVSCGFWSLLALVVCFVGGWCVKKFYFKR